MAELAVKQRELKEVMDKVQLLEDDLNITKQKKEDLENQVDDCTQKVGQGSKTYWRTWWREEEMV